MADLHLEPDQNRYSFSSVRQSVTIPTDPVNVTLRFWLDSSTSESVLDLSEPLHSPAVATVEEAGLTEDAQYVLVLNQRGQWIGTLLWQRRNDRSWTSHACDLKRYAGRTITLQFAAFNDGRDGATGMVVDVVALEVCTLP